MSISACCEQIDIKKEDLPKVLLNFNTHNEIELLISTLLKSLNDEDKSAIESCKLLIHMRNTFSYGRIGFIMIMQELKLTG